MNKRSQKKANFHLPIHDREAQKKAANANEKSIDQILQDYAILGTFESLHLYNQEGLVVAQYVSHGLLDESFVVEIAIKMLEIRTMMKKGLDVNDIDEIIVGSKNEKKLVIRFILLINQIAILVVIVPSHKPFRGIIRRLIKDVNFFFKGL